MSQLIQLRQRLKAIGTFKKITGAMRIVSRSLHTRMNKQKKYLFEYQKLIKEFFFDLQQQSDWTCEILFPQSTATEKKLYIIVGAQKGLCGNYNTELNYWIEHNLSALSEKNVSLITLGKKTSHIIRQHALPIFYQAPELKNSTLGKLSDTITNLLYASFFSTRLS
jgi:F-type H+-transporting ATPase subunit gamma